MKQRFTPSHGNQPKQARENRHVQAVEQAVPSLDEDDLMAIVAQKAVPFVLVLDCVQDPHNLGAVLRTAVASWCSNLPDKQAAHPPEIRRQKEPCKADGRAKFGLNEIRREFSQIRQIPRFCGAFFLSAFHYFSFTQTPLFPRNPHFPALRSSHELSQRPSPLKQFPSNWIVLRLRSPLSPLFRNPSCEFSAFSHQSS